MRHGRFFGVVVGVVLACGGCLSMTGSPDSNPPAGSNRPSSGTDAESADTNESIGPDQLAFGKSYTWEDGVTLTVSKPSPFKPNRYALVKGAKAYRKFTITVVNKSANPLDLNLAYITMQSNNKEAGEVFDTANGLEGSPATKLIKGRESKWDVGFGVVNPKDLVMEVSLQDSFERPSLIYST